MFVIIIENLKVHLDNLNLLLEKIQFDMSHQLKKKRLVSKHLVHYITNTKNLLHRGICSSRKNMQNSPFISKSNYHNLLQISTQVGGWEG